METTPTTSEERLGDAWEGLVQIILDIVQSRTPMVDKEGSVVTDDNGRPYMSLPSASHLREVRSLLKDMGFSAPPSQKGDEGSDTMMDQLAREAKKRGLRYDGRPLPPVDTESPDAATG